MSADLIVGLQYGSEGKGKVAAALAPYYKAAVRVGAPNAGHSVILDGTVYKMRQIPCAWVNPETKLFVGAGGLINPEVLEKELAMLPDAEQVKARFYIDRNAGTVLEQDIDVETRMNLNAHNGSTVEGIGAAQARKVLRKDGLLAKELPALERFITHTSRDVTALLEAGQNVMFEGTQGYGLCLNHGNYPYTTSRDILAASILSDAGISPLWTRWVFGVIRTYPIRVAGNSGPMGEGIRELTWEEVAIRAGYESLIERTTVTNKVRRVSEFDWNIVSEAIRANGVNGLFIMFIDYCDAKLRGAKTELELIKSEPAMRFIQQVEETYNIPVMGVSTGPGTDEMIWTSAGQSMLEGLKDKEAIRA